MINGILSLDPLSQQHLAKLDHTLVRVEITDWRINLLLEIHQGRVTLLDDHDLVPNVTLRGHLINILALLVKRSQHVNFHEQQIEIAGSQQVAEELYQAMHRFNINWQAKLNSIFGPTVGHAIGEAARNIKNTGQDASQQLKRSLSEYLRFEKGYLVSDEEVQLFSQDVKRLRHDVERLSARVAKLNAMVD